MGRTARAGRGGKAITLISEQDIALVHAIEEHVGVKMGQYSDIKEDEVLHMLNEVNIARRAGQLTSSILLA